MANGFIDTAIALRILYLLVVDIKSLPGYKLGLFGENGEILRKPKTTEEKNATSMLLRLVLRIRNFLSNVPLAQSKLGSYVSAYALVKECIEKDMYLPTVEQLSEHYLNLEHNVIVEQVINDFVNELLEDAPANASGTGVSTDSPTIKKRARATFTVSRDTFDKFKEGKAKFRRWGHYLNMEDENEQKIYHYAKKNPRGILVLQDEDGRSKGIRYSKHGGGNWHGIKRKPKQVLESYIEQDSYDTEVIDLC